MQIEFEVPEAKERLRFSGSSHEGAPTFPLERFRKGISATIPPATANFRDPQLIEDMHGCAMSPVCHIQVIPSPLRKRRRQFRVATRSLARLVAASWLKIKNDSPRRSMKLARFTFTATVLPTLLVMSISHGAPENHSSQLENSWLGRTLTSFRRDSRLEFPSD